MKTEFPSKYLRCMACGHDGTLVLFPAESNDSEVREGTLECRDCQTQYAVHRGVAHMLRDAPDHVEREAAGLERFADVMRADGWDKEKILQLPDIQDGYWYVQAQSMNQALATVNFKPGDSVLDVGSNTCWASNRFAELGLNAIALDIATAEMQGLYTADWWIDAGRSYFERVLGSMAAMPIASESLDFVFTCEVLHHNDEQSLRHTFEEIFRVLKPGGTLVAVNETLKTYRDPVGVHVEGVEQFEGYEHAHWSARYRGEEIRAGFRTRLIEPSYHWFFRPPATDETAGQVLRRRYRETGSVQQAARTATLHWMRDSPAGRRAYMSYLYHVAGNCQQSMIATKPLRLLGAPDAGVPERVARSLAASALTVAAAARRTLRGFPRRAARRG
jgi:SAM-dependent methyltransferase